MTMETLIGLGALSILIVLSWGAIWIVRRSWARRYTQGYKDGYLAKTDEVADVLRWLRQARDTAGKLTPPVIADQILQALSSTERE